MIFPRQSPFVALALSLALGAPVYAADARLADAFSPQGTGWTLRTAELRIETDGRVQLVDTPAPNASRETLGWTHDAAQVWAQPSGERQAAVAAYTIPAGAAGFYTISDSLLRRDSAQPGTIAVHVLVRHAGGEESRQPVPAVATTLEAGELFDFDAFLGYLDAGDTVCVAIEPDGDPAGDRCAIDFKLTPAPAIPVTVFPEDLGQSERIDAPGGWSLRSQIQANSPAARRLAWSPIPRDALPSTTSPRVTLQPAREGATVAAFRSPRSGYYALHDAWVQAHHAPVVTEIFVGDERAARRRVRSELSAGRSSLNTDLGYVAKGEVIALAFTSASNATGAAADFGGSIVEWAPRRAPLRVRRGDDGLLDVYEPDAPRRAIDIPAERWIDVPAVAGDATETIRQAFAAAQDRQHGDAYVGVRLEAGKTYVVGSQQTGGTLFPLRRAHRLVFDGHGATLRVASPELTRKELGLFSLEHSRNLALADFTVEAAAVPFTTGTILDVSPRGENTQTVTFRLNPGALDPLADISRDGRNNGYAYNPRIPGRLAEGTWTHYPGQGSPSIQRTDTAGVFTHRVTRTNDSIEPGGKWLIKNKRAGVVYLTTGRGTENITLSGVDGRAAGGGQLRFWQTSGINLLHCRFEPDGENWISSSADGVHGRGREGVWIEDTLIRGVCEDIMNTYGQNMIVERDDAPDDAVISLRMFTRSSESFDDGAGRVPTEESVAVGDQLVFFNPRTGRTLGYAQVLRIASGRFTLSNPVPDVEPWTPQAGKTATMVYNTRIAGRFFIRDSRFMDSMRFGVYIKARGGVIFGSQFEGLSAPAVFAANEPEWPEGPPATHLWVQGCTFSQNNHGYMPRHRDFMVVDPADISVYTRRLRDPAEPDDFRANLARGQHANSHLRFVGNVFHDWRGMGIAVRNARNVRIEDNLFLQPVNDDVMRRTLAGDATLSAHGRGAYAAIFLDSVVGVRVAGNRFHATPADDLPIAIAEGVDGVVRTDNVRTGEPTAQASVALNFSEWFGQASGDAAPTGAAGEGVRLRGASHRPGRFGAGLSFGGEPAAVVTASADFAAPGARFTIALWARPTAPASGDQVLFSHGDARGGVIIALAAGRWTAGWWQEDGEGSLDLGPAVAGLWQHVALAFDGEGGVARGYVDGLEIASSHSAVSSRWAAARGDAGLGGIAGTARLHGREVRAGSAGYRGEIDEFRWYPAPLAAADLTVLALRRPGEEP